MAGAGPIGVSSRATQGAVWPAQLGIDPSAPMHGLSCSWFGWKAQFTGLEYAQNSLAQKVKSDLPRHLVFFLFFIA